MEALPVRARIGYHRAVSRSAPSDEHPSPAAIERGRAMLRDTGIALPEEEVFDVARGLGALDRLRAIVRPGRLPP